jgi:hypothetical protein
MAMIQSGALLKNVQGFHWEQFRIDACMGKNVPIHFDKLLGFFEVPQMRPALLDPLTNPQTLFNDP